MHGCKRDVEGGPKNTRVQNRTKNHGTSHELVWGIRDGKRASLDLQKQL